MKYIIKFYVTVETFDLDSAQTLVDELTDHIDDFDDEGTVVEVSSDDPEHSEDGE